MATHLDEPLEAALPAPRVVNDESLYLNREVSWLDFNARVLAQAEDPSVPLLERAKFLAIFSQNLDEFFQVRIAGLKDQLAAGLGVTSPDGLSPAEQIALARLRVSELMDRQSRVFQHDIAPALAEHAIRISDWEGLDDDDRRHLVQVFEERVFPVLTPLAVDPGHPFPYISNLSLNLAVLVRDPSTGDRRFARVKVPPLLPRFVAMPDRERFVPLEQVIAAHLGALFPGMEILGHSPFRVTRNADLMLEEEEAEDLLAAVELELRRRRFGRAVRLEVDASMSEEIRQLLMRELDLEDQDLFVIDGPLDLGGLWTVHGLDRPELKDDVWAPVTQPRLAPAGDEHVDLFAVLRDGDILVHHPYESFTTSVEAFIEQAAADPHVLAIKQTLYRTSGDSPIVKSLIRAAERGKQVAVLVEVKARFDEQANIAWARALEQAGVHVVYGLLGLKTHTKTALVVREEVDGIRRYCHVGTGNYNGRTARLYEDIGLLTCDPQIGADLTDLFNYLTGYSRQVRYRKLLVAPVSLRPSIVGLVRDEMDHGTDGRIIMKMNSLADAELIDVLYDASRAGVRIDLIVRGICCLRPGVAGLSENIRVRSIVGRYLEHSRIYAFGTRERRRYLTGSADLMTRNLDDRVEAVCPVEDLGLQARLQEILDVNLADDVLAWELDGRGQWRRVPNHNGCCCHVQFHELAIERARRREADTRSSLRKP
jgi:polyphosphate kinase